MARANEPTAIHAAAFAFGGSGILFGVSSRDGIVTLALGFAVIVFVLRRDLWNALRGRQRGERVDAES